MIRKLLIISILLLLCSCGVSTDFKKIDEFMSKGDCKSTLKLMKESKDDYGSKAELLYLLDSAMINMHCGNLTIAKQLFIDAESLAQSLWTESVSQNVAAMATNNMVLSYSGEDFERAMINLFNALTYLKSGDLEGALIECRKLDVLLGSYNEKYKKNKNVYKEDAFGRYLSGIINEADGEIDDAYIDYYKAFNVYKDYARFYGTIIPVSLIEDYLRVARAVGRFDEAKRLIPNYSNYEHMNNRRASKMGRIVFIQLNGHSPVKLDKKIIANTNKGPVTIAFPQYKVNRPFCRTSEVLITQGEEVINKNCYLVEDINKIAVKALADRKARIITKAIARAIVKQAVNKGVSDKIDGVGGLLFRVGFNVVNSAFLEKADTRTWRTLPGEIYMTSAYVNPGELSVGVSRCGYVKQLEDVTVKAGETKFIIYNSIYE